MKPSEYGGWPGPDGEPDTLCGWGDHGSCDMNEECVDDTIIVDKQTTVSRSRHQTGSGRSCAVSDRARAKTIPGFPAFRNGANTAPAR